MEINTTRQDGRTIVALVGLLDSSSAPQFNAEIENLLAEKEIDILLDLERLEYLSSQGLRLVLSLMKGVSAAEGKLAFKGAQTAVMDVFQMSGLAKLMTFED